jgi:triacylglycerol lipase
MPKKFKLILTVTITLIGAHLMSSRAEIIPVPKAAGTDEHVILLHGLVRSPRTMEPMAKALREAGYKTTIVNYPSRKKNIKTLTDDHLAPAVASCQKKGAKKIHFVTHSLGGILVRDYLSRRHLPELGRVVMLCPPNQGSEVVDKIGHWRTFKLVNGPAGGQLGTGATSAPKTLGPVTYPLGIIAGDRSINPINSYMISGTDDGKVSIENTKLEGMTDHIVLHSTHPMIMRSTEAIQLTMRFLRHQSFTHDANGTP